MVTKALDEEAQESIWTCVVLRQLPIPVETVDHSYDNFLNNVMYDIVPWVNRNIHLNSV